jgi:hypothetical protein
MKMKNKSHPVASEYPLSPAPENGRFDPDSSRRAAIR